ncbi:MAG: Gfo/Idh/MocA family oxidoreductase, partial [Clostridiales bacterium]|nr:Gfo/Idh/MocA family oxidoreductase [Clostridiales bacterium]
RCVYACDNDVVDNQIVNMEFENGIHCQLMMTAFTSHGGRSIRILGTRGAIEADMHRNLIEIQPFGEPVHTIDVSKLGRDLAGHGGGDGRLVAEFLSLLHDGGEPAGRVTTLTTSAESHYIAFAAEYSRTNGGMAVEVAQMRPHD